MRKERVDSLPSLSPPVHQHALGGRIKASESYWTVGESDWAGMERVCEARRKEQVPRDPSGGGGGNAAARSHLTPSRRPPARAYPCPGTRPSESHMHTHTHSRSHP